MQDSNIGGVVRTLRNRLGMTQEEFAHSLGITVSTVNRWENGHSAPSKLAKASIVGLANKHGLTLDPLSLTVEAPQTKPEAVHAFVR
ncbi:MAG: helix-turn-helix domain-containing protein [Candidatus Binatia bacterium]